MNYLLLFFILIFACNKNANIINEPKDPSPTTNTPTPTPGNIDYYITNADKSYLLSKQEPIGFKNTAPTSIHVEIDTTAIRQTVDGFGYTLTEASAYLIGKMSTKARQSLLNELFSNGQSSIKINYIRVSVGASDLSREVYTYDGQSNGQADTTFSKFSFSVDSLYLIPILKEIIVINPLIKILATPWTAPVWMKDNNNSKGGRLKREYYSAYAKYLALYISKMKSEGIIIEALSPQNEPLHGGNNPSMEMSAAEQALFIKSALGPTFEFNGIKTKIFIYDHNCDRPDYPLAILDDAAANKYVDGSAFHLYGGDISALTKVHDRYPTKNVYFTEQWTGSKGDFGSDLMWHIKNVMLGSMRNWSKIALEWNLANDPAYSLHTIGGCTECKGALTIQNDDVTKNVAYYIVGHLSKFVPSGSKVIYTTSSDLITSIAFYTPQNKKVLVVLNEANQIRPISFGTKGENANVYLPARSVSTFIW